MSQAMVRRNRLFRLVPHFVLAVTLFFSYCEKDDKYDIRVIDPEEDLKELKIIVVSGNYQTGAVGDTLPDSLVVYVSDRNNIAEPSWKVDFVIIQGEGTLSPKTNITDVNGFTGTILIPTGLPGEIRVEAIPYMSKNSVVFSATSTD